MTTLPEEWEAVPQPDRSSAMLGREASRAAELSEYDDGFNQVNSLLRKGICRKRRRVVEKILFRAPR